MINIECREAVDFLKHQAADSVDGVVTSPPYNIGVKYDGFDDSRVDYIEWSKLWIKEALRISRKGLMLNVGAKASDRNSLAFLTAAIAEIGIIQNEIIWVKSIYIDDKTVGHFKPINSRRYTNNTHEHILHVVKNAPVDINKLGVGVPFEDKSNIERFGSNSSDLRCRGSVWFLPYETRTAKLDHPATYPLALAEMMIKFLDAKSVCDPFVGSGTTAIAAMKLGADFTGCDQSQEYVNKAVIRISEHR
jgi:site-specific DNA-methyltransferase (adenine-specific)